MAMSMDAVPGTYGALLLGAFFASGLSGVVSVQCIVYFKLYPKDKKILKCLVVSVWLLDLIHSIFVWSAMWESLIANFGVKSKVDSIPRTIPLSVIFTAVLTFFAQCFFAHRILLLSKMNWFLAAPILLLAGLRLTAASVSGAEMVTLETYTNFRTDFRWLFSVGLALSTAVDLLITLSLFMLLHRSRRQSMSLNLIIDSLILYALEIGSLTCAATIASMICWLKLDNNLVFLGVHFVIGKLYANSLLATLNTRQEIGRNRAIAHDLMDLEIMRNPQGIRFVNPQAVDTQFVRPSVQVSVEKRIHLDAVAA